MVLAVSPKIAMSRNNVITNLVLSGCGPSGVFCRPDKQVDVLGPERAPTLPVLEWIRPEQHDELISSIVS